MKKRVLDKACLLLLLSLVCMYLINGLVVELLQSCSQWLTRGVGPAIALMPGKPSSLELRCALVQVCKSIATRKLQSHPPAICDSTNRRQARR